MTDITVPYFIFQLTHLCSGFRVWFCNLCYKGNQIIEFNFTIGTVTHQGLATYSLVTSDKKHTKCSVEGGR